MSDQLDFSVLIPTYNRADILSLTLSSMEELDLTGLRAEFVVIDNNSNDDTRAVAESFVDRLPLRYLFEATPGKSSALNRALNDVPLGELVVLTDDDIVPREDWLQAIRRVSDRWPEHSVFGGRIELVWPEGPVPGWAQHDDVKYWAMGHHDKGPTDVAYTPRNYPGGANYWIRRSVLDRGHRFDTGVGPRPEKYKVMGTETAFLYGLTADGHEIIYSPEVEVGHRVQPSLLEVPNVKRRAFRWGRGMPTRGICHPDLFRRHRVIWTLIRFGSLVRHGLSYALAMVTPNSDRRVVKTLNVVTCLGYDFESLRIAFRGGGE